MREGVPSAFRAFRVHVDEGGVRRGVEEVPVEVLPDHDVVVWVKYSSLNYKDALSASGNRGVTKAYPHTPGIDVAGEVAHSRDPRFAVGDCVICTDHDLGMDTPGGFAQYVSVPGDWLLPPPEGLPPHGAMALGTAGLTAALALRRLAAAGVTPALGPLVVTGASGGVGSLAVWLAARAGYEVHASTGTPEAAETLTRLGAARVVPREELASPTDRPLLRGELAGAIDTVGGTTLANLLKRTAVGGAVAACGLVGGAELVTTVFPFILRGVALMGVDSQHAPRDERVAAWEELAAAWREDGSTVERIMTVAGLDELEEHVQRILAGRTVGRVVVSPQPPGD